VADELTPSETISLPKHLILGFATDRAASRRSLSFWPVRSASPPSSDWVALQIVKTGDMLLLDGSRGKVILNPGHEERLAFEKMVARSKTLEEALDRGKCAPGATSDGHASRFWRTRTPARR
jgi:phosphotransferase system enzyme I (PtsI)